MGRAALGLGPFGFAQGRFTRAPSPHNLRILLCDYATGYAVAGVSRRIGFLVIGFGVDYKRCASVAEYGVAALAPGHVFIFPLEMRFAVRVNREVGIVSGVVAFGIFQSMLFAIGIEMRACGLKVRRLTLCVLMKMDSVFAGRQILDVDFDADAWAGLPENCAARYLALSILELN